MKKITLLVGLTLVIGGLAWADTPVTLPATQPSTQPTIVTGTLGKPEHTSKVATVLGQNGVLFIHSEARWDELNKLLPNLTPDTPMPKFDFAKQTVVLVYSTARRPNDRFSCPKVIHDATPAQLEFFLGWDQEVLRLNEAPSSKLILAIIPATPTVKVTLRSEPIDTFNVSTVTEFSATLGDKDGGDIVDGLQASITPKAATIKPGEDILIDFELHLAKMPDAHPQQFGSPLKSDYVWNAAGSAGYRNYKFFVISPDGKTTVLRPKEIAIWHDNPVNLIEITAKAPYSLPNSLKDFGLDTSTPGTYIITGLYEESGDKGTRPDGGKAWGGSIASNTITVEVKK